VASDLDQDGDQDLVLGNRGENFYFSGQSADELKLWIHDFDQNGTVENIVTRNVNGKDIPVPMKKELTVELPLLKKENLKHKDYARSALQDLIPQEKLVKALVLNSSYHSNIVAWNKGNGTFDIERLPAEVQLSCVTAIAIQDMNQDGKPDLILGGNHYGMLPQFSSLDAGIGHILLNNGINQWQVMNSKDSGWRIKGEIKSLDIFSYQNSRFLFTVRNNDKPLLFSFNEKIDF
jgi:hypothetical protein